MGKMATGRWSSGRFSILLRKAVSLGVYVRVPRFWLAAESRMYEMEIQVDSSQ